jgi:DNA helicase-2/ATP-dependent DNA helicase PcrA
VSRLTFAAEDDPTARPVDPSRVLIVMFNAALRSFVQTSLEPLRLEQAELATFHHWALESVKRAYKGTLDINPDTKAIAGHETAARMKKQLGMLRALDEFVAEQTRGAAEWLDKRLAPYHATALVERFRTMDAPVARRFITLREEALRQRNASVGNAQARWENIYQVLRQGVTRITLYKEELLRFLTSTSLLARHLEGASLDDLRALADFQRAVQNEDGTSGKPGPRVTFDDLALLLRLIQLKHGGLADATREEEVFVYDHLVVDEAQDFGALELRVLLSAVRSRTGVTIVGDHNQKIVPAAEFMGWDALARELGLDGADVTKLKLAHRATAPIMALARTLEDADGDAPDDDNEGVAGRPGPLPERIVADTETSLREAVVEGLRQSLAEAPRGHHCVVCRWPKQAQAVLAWLAPALDLPDGTVRIGHNMGFVFGPGVTVTNAQQVKGLEFDSVTVIDPTAAHYPDNDVGRRNLYTVLTRAKDRLRLVSTQATTSLLDAAIARGLLAEVRVGALAPVAFTPEEDDPF